MRIYSVNEVAGVKPIVGDYYYSEQEIFFDPAVPSSWKVNDFIFPDRFEEWKIIDACLIESNFFKKNVSFSRTRIIVLYPHIFTGWQHLFQRMYIQQGKGHESAIFHEYGHSVMSYVYGSKYPPTWSLDHYLNTESSGPFALVEGWAEFMPAILYNSHDTYSFYNLCMEGDSIENNVWWKGDNCEEDNSGEIVEGAVASIWWDIYDGANSETPDDDNLEAGFQPIWDIISKDNPQNINEFWDHWFDTTDNTPTDYGHLYEMISIFYDHGIDKRLWPGELCGYDDNCRSMECEGAETLGIPARCCRNIVNPDEPGVIDYYCDEFGDVHWNEECVDADSDGYESSFCGGLDCNDGNPEINPEARELCDDVDNNCNRQIDEGCKCTDGESMVCGTNEGACSTGLKWCRLGEWSDCEGEIGPEPETCPPDEIDNDCDGETDEINCIPRDYCIEDRFDRVYHLTSDDDAFGKIRTVTKSYFCPNNWETNDIDDDGYKEEYLVLPQGTSDFVRYWVACRTVDAGLYPIRGFFESGDDLLGCASSAIGTPSQDISYCGDDEWERHYYDIPVNSPTDLIEVPDRFCEVEDTRRGELYNYGWYGFRFISCWDENSNGVYCDEGDRIEPFMVLQCGVDSDCDPGFYCYKSDINNPLGFECRDKCGDGICDPGENCPRDGRGPEDCNDIDDDCNGIVDDNLAITCHNDDECIPEDFPDDRCIRGTYRNYYCVNDGKCDSFCTYETVITDEDRDGYDTECDGDCDDSRANVNPGGTETCDGLDNDCNKVVDDGLTPPLCEEQDGVCMGAVKRCGGTRGWLDCNADNYGDYYEEVETSCDGLDNDCDGEIDEELTTPLCDLQEGVCSGSTKICGGELGWLDCDASSYGPDYEDEETLCDGLDNDCDGEVDGGDICEPECIVPEDGMTIEKDTIFCRGEYNLNSGFIIQGSNIILDCNDSVITGSGRPGSRGVWFSGAYNITIKNCLINNYKHGIQFERTDLIKIINNSLYIMFYPITSTTSVTNIMISKNSITDTLRGIEFGAGHDILISDNVILSNERDITLLNFRNVSITGNRLNDILLDNTAEFNIIENEISDGNWGLRIEDSRQGNIEMNKINGYLNCLQLIDSSTLTYNNILQSCGTFVLLRGLNDNTIYYNYFIDQTDSRRDPAWDSRTNRWDNGTHGNYWSNYNEPSEGCEDLNRDRICDSPFNIPGGDNKDNFPILPKEYVNSPPRIISEPVNLIYHQEMYVYDVEAEDPNGDRIYYLLNTEAWPIFLNPPVINADTGEIRWWPTIIGVTPPLRVIASDGMGQDIQAFTIEVRESRPENRPPQIISEPVTEAFFMEVYEYQVVAEDPENDTLTYTLNDYPEGMEIESDTGLVTWSPEISDIGHSYNVEVIVEDSRSNVANQTFTVLVMPPRFIFIRGDANDDGEINIADPVFILNYLFGGGETPLCLDASDTNDDGAVDIGDAIVILNYLFSSGSPLPEPFPLPGPDPTLDDLICEEIGCGDCDDGNSCTEDSCNIETSECEHTNICVVDEETCGEAGAIWSECGGECFCTGGMGCILVCMPMCRCGGFNDYRCPTSSFCNVCTRGDDRDFMDGMCVEVGMTTPEECESAGGTWRDGCGGIFIDFFVVEICGPRCECIDSTDCPDGMECEFGVCMDAVFG